MDVTVRPKVVFLVYDSRSGSTLLASQIAKNLDRVLVTPEIGFDELLQRGDEFCRRNSSSAITSLLIRKRDFINLGIAPAVLDSWFAEHGHPQGIRHYIEQVCGCLLAQQSKDGEVVIVKNGSHARYIPRLVEAFGEDLRILHIFRDPRAVVNSKNRTPRPYYPYETMGWGGVALSAWRWVCYSRVMRRAITQGVSVYEISYENFLADPKAILAGLAEFLGVGISDVPSRNDYVIPSKEKTVHARVHSGTFDGDRSVAWRQELQSGDLKRVEAVSQTEMILRGYEPTRLLSMVQRCMTVASAVPDAISKSLRHYCLQLLKRNYL